MNLKNIKKLMEPGFLEKEKNRFIVWLVTVIFLAGVAFAQIHFNAKDIETLTQTSMRKDVMKQVFARLNIMQAELDRIDNTLENRNDPPDPKHKEP